MSRVPPLSAPYAVETRCSCLHAAITSAANFEEVHTHNTQSKSSNPKPLPIPILKQVIMLLVTRHNMSLDDAASHAGETAFQLAKRMHGVRAHAFFEYLHSRAEQQHSSAAAAAAAAAAVAAAASPSGTVHAPLSSTSQTEERVAPAFIFDMWATPLMMSD